MPSHRKFVINIRLPDLYTATVDDTIESMGAEQLRIALSRFSTEIADMLMTSDSKEVTITMRYSAKEARLRSPMGIQLVVADSLLRFPNLHLAGWECSNCNYSNKRFDDECEMCGFVRR